VIHIKLLKIVTMLITYLYLLYVLE